MMEKDALYYIEHLGLEPHTEGGYTFVQPFPLKIL